MLYNKLYSFHLLLIMHYWNYYVFQWNTQHIFLIMEYCDGGDLSHFIHSRQILAESTARRFLRQLGNTNNKMNMH